PDIDSTAYSKSGSSGRRTWGAPRPAPAGAPGWATPHAAHGRGVFVDERLRTSDPDIYAAGDVASFPHALFDTRLRVEHWANALNGGPAAARAMLGQDVTYDRVPYFFSDQYDLGMEYSGWAPAGSYDQVVIRGDAGKREFIAFWVKEGRVLAGMNVNVWDVTEPIQKLIRSRAQVNTENLANPHIPLEDLIP
ncbi:oxidoreductase C-terminal domain-containing protein, partial [Streptomyces sp. NPDC059374]|uniref:oxidoreductase C-terminal domain-containing protein n=1 Tax=Streptomyces sp. NPDC059374 TaxID=3346814 RepID=UPI0036A4B640